MVLESTMVCVDNSEYMRNGDYIPTRLQAQQDAVNLICHSKTRSNPENNVGLLTLANTEVLVTLTTDVGRILSKLHQVQPKGNINLLSGIRIAHLALRHRQGKNHKMRIVVFVGSPIETDEKELVKLGKRLKKEKVNVDIVNFGEDSLNSEKLTSFVNIINGKDGAGSHLVTIPPGPHLSEALLTSAIIQGEDGTGAIGLGSAAGFEFGVDPNEDPELALALRVSMEEQRQRQEEEARRAAAQSAAEAGVDQMADVADGDGTSEEALLEKALAMSLAQESQSTAPEVLDFAAMTEEEQIAYAMKMSLQGQQSESKEAVSEDADKPVPMETDDAESSKKADNEDYSEVMSDPAFLQSVLENLPGVDPHSEAIRTAMGALSQQHQDKAKKDKGNKSDKSDKADK